MRVVVGGASGLIGTALTASLRRDGHDVTRLVRRPPAAPDEVHWQPELRHVPPLGEVDAVVCLNGASIPIRRPTAALKRRLRASRTDAVATLAEAVAASKRRPPLIAASAVGYYGDTGEAIVDESARPGTGFLARLCQDWEDAARPATEAGARVVSLRSGVVLAREGGFVARLRPFVWSGIAGPQGSGQQFVSWVSLSDEVRAIRLVLESDISGPVNVAAPNPTRNAELVATFARLMHRPAVVPVPAVALRLLLGEFAGDVLGGQRAVPAALTAAGFRFRDTDLEWTLRPMVQ